MDANGVLAYSYDDTDVAGQLATTEVVAAAGPGGVTPIDFDEILRRCYDPATASLRVVFI
jgi:hypothetical protein